jgi:ABC-2 type transport system permease protein
VLARGREAVHGGQRLKRVSAFRCFGVLSMIRALRLTSLFAQVSIQNFAAYRFDLFTRFFVSLMHLAGELIAVWTIFSNTTSVNGWRWQHMLVLAGVFRIVAGGIRISIVPNMQRVLQEIHAGTLDFVLLKPVNAQLLVSIREFVVWRVVDILLGLSIALYGCYALVGHVPIVQTAVFFLMLLAGFGIVYSVWLILVTACFWFVRIQNIEMIFWNVFEAGRFPIAIYRPWLQWTLTYIIPLAFITSFPAGVLAGDPGTGVSNWAPMFAVLMAVASFAAASWFWRYGLRRYSGASA